MPTPIVFAPTDFSANINTNGGNSTTLDDTFNGAVNIPVVRYYESGDAEAGVGYIYLDTQLTDGVTYELYIRYRDDGTAGRYQFKDTSTYDNNYETEADYLPQHTNYDDGAGADFGIGGEADAHCTLITEFTYDDTLPYLWVSCAYENARDLYIDGLVFLETDNSSSSGGSSDSSSSSVSSQSSQSADVSSQSSQSESSSHSSSSQSNSSSSASSANSSASSDSSSASAGSLAWNQYSLSCMPCCRGACCDIVPDGFLCMSLSGSSCLNGSNIDLSNLGQPSGQWIGAISGSDTSCTFGTENIDVVFTWDGSTCTGTLEITCDGETASNTYTDDDIVCEDTVLTSITVSLSFTGSCAGTVTATIVDGVCP